MKLFKRNKDYKRDIDAFGYLRYVGVGGDIKPIQPNKKYTDYSYLFAEREDITSLDLSDWDMKDIRKTFKMFFGFTGGSIIMPKNLLAFIDCDIRDTFMDTKIDSLDMSFDVGNANIKPSNSLYCVFGKNVNITTLTMFNVFNTNQEFEDIISAFILPNNIKILKQDYKSLSEKEFDKYVKSNLVQIEYKNSCGIDYGYHNSELGKFRYKLNEYKLVVKEDNMYLHYIPQENRGIYGDYKPLQPIGLINMKNLFYQLDVFKIDLSEWDFSEVVDMSYMFACSYNLKFIYLSGITKIEEAYRIFYMCNSLEIIYMSNSNFEKIGNTSEMFHINNDKFLLYLSNSDHKDKIVSFLPRNAEVIDNSSYGEDLGFYKGGDLGCFEYDIKEYEMVTIDYSSDHKARRIKYIGKSSTPTQPIGCINFTYTFNNIRNDSMELDLSHWDSSCIKNVACMFGGNIRKINLSNWSFYDISNQNTMFDKLYNLEELIIKNTRYSKIPHELSFKGRENKLKIIK